MNTEDPSPRSTAAQLERNLRKSQGLLPAHLLFLAVTIALYALAEHFFELNWILRLLLLWAGPFILIVDVVNIVYCRLALARARKQD